MAQRANGSTGDARVAHETEVALRVTWLVSLARAIRT
jgi:hypothetical protein